jgi:hypothetical protein
MATNDEEGVLDLKPHPRESGGVANRLLQKMLMPIVATAASAAATYAAKKGPQVLEEKVMPRVRELMDGAGQDLPSRAKSVAGDAGDVAERLTERVREAAGGAVQSAGDSVKAATGSNGHRHRELSSKELERRRQGRAKARAGRRKATR